MLPPISSSRLMVVFILSSLSTAKADTSCRYILDGSGMMINSRNFPNDYPNSHTCTWQITVKSGDKVSLRFFLFNTETNYDQVNVYDGTSRYDKRIATYSGRTVPALTISTGNSMYVDFTTDGSVRRSGFIGVLTTDGYSLALKQSSGIIQSPKYALPFPAGSIFTWTITVNIWEIISLEFDNLTTISNCQDSLKAYDGNSTIAQLLGYFNNCSLPSSAIKSTNNQMLIVFESLSGDGSNFILEYNSHPANGCFASGFQLCDQNCTDIVGTFECSCHEGFKIDDADKYKCEECDEWTYGMACSNSCQCNVNTTSYCNKTDGSCVCIDGMTGLNCSIETLPKSLSVSKPLLDEKTSWIITGILCFLLLIAVIAIAVLVYKWKKETDKNSKTKYPQTMSTPSLGDVIPNISSNVQPSREWGAFEEVNDDSDSLYEIPVSPSVHTKIEKPKAVVSNKYGEFPRSLPHPEQNPTGRESEIYENTGATTLESCVEEEGSDPEDIYQNVPQI